MGLKNAPFKWHANIHAKIGWAADIPTFKIEPLVAKAS